MVLSAARGEEKMGRNLLSRLITSLGAFTSDSIRGVISWLASKRPSDVRSEHSAVWAELRGYAAGYGGWNAFIRSPVLWVAIGFAALLTPLWNDRPWPQITFDIVPGLLGFSLGAMAIVLSFPSRTILNLISEGGRPDSYYMELAYKFLRFIFAKVISLLFGTRGKVFDLLIINIIDGISLVYVILTGGATALALFGVAQIYNHPNSTNEPADGGDDSN